MPPVKKRFQLALVLLAVGLVNVARGQAPVVLSAATTSERLSPHLAVWRDGAGAATLGEAQAAWQAGQFTPLGERPTGLGFTKDAVWVRFALRATTPTRAVWYVRLSAPIVDEVDWFMLRAGEEVAHAVDGIRQARGGAGTLPGVNPTLVAGLDADTTTEIFVRLRSLRRMDIRFTVFSPEAHLRQAEKENLFVYFCLGAFAVLGLLGIMQALFTRSWGFLTYAVSAAMVWLLLMGAAGYWRHWEWPGWRYAMHNGQLVFNGLAVIALLAYLRWFFSLAEEWPRVDRGLRWGMVLMGGLVVWMAAGSFPLRQAVMDTVSLVAGAASLTIGIMAWRRGNRTARFYVLAWWVFWVLVVLELGQDWRWWSTFTPNNLLPTVGLLVGFLLFQAAMADRLRQEQLSRALAQARADLLLQEQTAELERQVATRTTELSAAMRELAEANQRLLENQQRLETMLRAIPDIVFRMDAAGTILEFHAATQDLLHVPPVTLLYQKVSAVLPEQAARILMAALAEAEAHGEHRGSIYSLPQPDGGARWFELAIAALPLVADRAAEYLVVVRDITKRREAQDARLAAEQKFRLLAENMKDVIWILDAETLRFLYVSPSVEKLRGYTPEEVMAEPLDAAMSPEQARQFWESTRNLAESLRASGQAFSSFITEEVPQPRKDGTIVHTEAIVRYWLNPQTNRVEIHGVTRDISERKRAAEDLQARQAALAEAQRIAHVGNWTYDTTSSMREWSTELYRIFGLDPDQPPPATAELHAMFEPESRARLQQELADCLATGVPFGAAFTIRLANGERRRIDMRGECISGTQTLRGTCANVTELWRAEEELRQRQSELEVAKEAAERANYAKGLFLASMSHEIRTPLSALVGLSQAMVRLGARRGLPEDFLRMLEQIRAGGRHLNMLLTNLLDISSTEGGQPRVHWRTVDLAEWAQQMRDILQPIAEAHQVRLRWEAEELVGATLTSDPARLAQILINLVHNAVKFTPAGREVTVRFTRTPEMFACDVWDEGEGLAPDMGTSPFEAFSAGTQPVADLEHGVGLGLYVVQTNARLLGGRVHAQNRPTGGAHFRVEWTGLN